MVASRNALVLTIGLAVGVGCSNPPPASSPSTNEAPPQPAPTAAPPLPEAAPPAAPPAPQPGTEPQAGATTTPSAPVEAPLTDEQILAVLDASNKKEIDEAQLAQTKAKSKDVKAYAKVITQHHTEAKAKQAKLAKKLGITAADSDKSKQLTDETQHALEQLKALQGADFDQQFVATMIKDHQNTLDFLDRKALPDAKNADLKALVEKDLRPTIEKHLKDAEALSQKLGTAGAGATGTQGGAQPPGAGTKEAAPPPK
ncbi:MULTISPECIES: DUF4142 domain-containing protein [Sorangium]|uniref:DUF4142 domain-containing protein n=1 Tax=Sorangium atrum TaxID=2995308 RepID=A0ABT5C212_9BACT|nr:DUF4142 domain-containing protein [Sorangium aterium]MDC0679885.1 DUF4142 domain-containing protein [Sorangium aterium]